MSRLLSKDLIIVCITCILPLSLLACGAPDRTCKNESDCVSGEHCQNNQCIPDCQNDSECNNGESCLSTGRCGTKTQPTNNCGNGVIDQGEECDGTALNGQTCQTKGFDSGDVKCSATCTFDTSGCTKAQTKNDCGNGVVDQGEECDGTALNNQTCQTKGFDSGDIKCSATCTFDTSACKKSQPTNDCGNGVIDQGEECDGTALDSQTCQTKGFDSGDIKCSAACKFDTSGCANASGKKAFGQICEKSTDCEDDLICVIANSGQKGYCAATCSQTKPCPNSPPNATCALKAGDDSICGWECSPTASNQCPTGLNCTPLGSSHYCTANPPPTPAKCGNNTVETGEECDGTDLRNQSCTSQGYVGGSLSCKNCQFDTSACTGPKPSSFGQQCTSSSDCDAGQVCVSFTNTLSICTAKCSDTQPCPGNPPGASCRFKLQSGDTICGWATKSGAPPVCGNGAIETGEECDGSAIQSTCQGIGFGGGTLKCNSSCRYDTSSCTGTNKCTNLPNPFCAAGCDNIARFSPDVGQGYIVTHGDRYSWLRRGPSMVLKYATAMVKCMYPGTANLGFGDMSMQNGGTPADTSGRLRHPQGTHIKGNDIDLAYYQVNTPNNYLRAVCQHTTNGQDQYHCVAQPHLLDPVKTAYFLAKILEYGSIRVIGVDGKIGPLIEAEMTKLHQKGLIHKSILDQFKNGSVTWEETDKGRGWFRFHHHHAHISFN